MKCKNCGNEVMADQSFCTKCGAPVVKNEGGTSQNGFNNPPPQPKQKKRGVPVWLFIIVILLIVAVMSSVYFFVLRDKDDEDIDSKTSSSRDADEDEDDDEKDSKKKKDDDDDDDKKNEVKNKTSDNKKENTTNAGTITKTSNSSSYYKVVVGNYTVKIPDNLIYTVNENKIQIANEEMTWVAHVSFAEATYTNYASNIQSVAEYLTSNGLVVSKSQEKTVNGVQSIVFEASESGINSVVAYMRVNSMNMAAVQVINVDYTTYDYDALNEIASIVTTAEKNNTSTTSMNIKSNTSIDYFAAVNK